MKAKVYLQLPFTFNIPEGAQFSVLQITYDSYAINFFPPVPSSMPSTDEGDLTINSVKAFTADTLHIEFHKDSFDRKVDSPMDPSQEIIENVVNGFLERLRFVSNNHHIIPISFRATNWRIEYLTDSGEPLEPIKGLIRGRGGNKVSFSWSVLTPEIWCCLADLDEEFEAPLWNNLLLDANRMLPEVGPAIVLASTSLEVFIADVLDKLARKNNISNEFWDWINRKAGGPSLTDQYDQLLKCFSGKSLRDNDLLWKAFEELKDARNNFVHEGKVAMGKKAKQAPLDIARTAELLGKTREIINFICELLDNDLKWPKFSHSIQLEFKKKIA